MRSKLALLSFLFAAVVLAAAPSAPPALEEVIFDATYLKQTLGPKTTISPIAPADDFPPAMMQAIQAARLDESCELSTLPQGATPLKRLRSIAPKFPDAARRSKTSGRAAFLVNVGADGQVVGLYCYQSSDRVFAVAAAQAMISWKFKPAQINHTSIPVLTGQLFEFEARN